MYFISEHISKLVLSPNTICILMYMQIEVDYFTSDGTNMD